MTAGATRLLDDKAIGQAVRAARALPKELRAEFRLAVNREVASPFARSVQAAAARQSVKAARAFRNRGVAVKPGEEPTVVVGGPEPYAGKAKMRTIAYGAEFGGGSEYTTYTRRGRKRGGRRGAAHQVTRRTAGWAGRPAGWRTGRFVYPTMQKEAPAMQDAFLRILARVTDEVWGRIG